MIRAFIAIELPENLRREIASLQEKLRSTGADVKWVEPSNLHLTLKFLGNVEEAQASALIEALKSPVESYSAFPMRLEGIGAFPGTTSPRVIWVGTSEGGEALKKLAANVEKVCTQLGFPSEERPFSGHLTVGRVRSKDRLAALVKELQIVEFQAGARMLADRLILFRSTLFPKGSIYTSLAEFPIGQ